MKRYLFIKTLLIKTILIITIIVFPYTGYTNSIFPTGKVETGKFTVEYVYNFVSKTYTPEVQFKTISKEKASYQSPEEAFIAQFSAMINEDYTWWLSSWNALSQEEISARDKKQNRTADSWAKIWKDAMNGQTIKLVKKIETGPFVFINYKMLDHTGKETFNALYVCKNEAGKWLATQELASDLMFHHYLEGKSRVVINVR